MNTTGIKNAVHGWYKSAAEYVMPVNEKSEFNEKGVLTPEEFTKAGCQLVYKCPTWSWESGDSKKKKPYLPDNQQYLISRNLPCLKRVKSLINSTANNEQIVENGEWLNMENDNNDQTNTDQIAQELNIIYSMRKIAKSVYYYYSHYILHLLYIHRIQEIDLDNVGNNDNKKDEDENGENKPQEQPQIKLDENYGAVDDKENANKSDEEAVMIELDHYKNIEDEDPNALIPNAPKEEEKKVDESITKVSEPIDTSILKTRTYDVSITYDKYYRVPRVWLRGYDENGNPLSSTEIFEDISADHAHKTVTVEPHVHTGVVSASIHPCRHSEVMKRFMTKFEESGKSITVDQYLFLFLKFMSAVIPTIQYDFTQSVDSK